MDDSKSDQSVKEKKEVSKNTNRYKNNGSNKDKDRSLKLFLSDFEVFSDVVNGIVFKGKQVVKPIDLQDGFTDNQFKDDDSNSSKTHFNETIRDVCMKWKLIDSSLDIAYLSFENQSTAKPKMLTRIMKYDIANIEKQLDTGRSPIIPPITIVLYTGKKNWNCPSSLYELYNLGERFKTFPKELVEVIEPIINNYKIIFYPLNNLEENSKDNFRNDSKLVIDFLMQYSKDRLDKFDGLPQTLKNPNLVINVFDAFSSGDHEWRNAYSSVYDRKKEGITMCDIVKELKNQGHQEGKLEGKLEGYEEARQESAKEMELMKKKLASFAEENERLKAELAKYKNKQ